MSRIFVHRCDFAERLNPILHEIICRESNNKDLIDQGALMTSWKMFYPEFLEVSDCAISLLKKLGVNQSLKLIDLWGQIYKPGDFQMPHTHHPHDFSFVYYVNAPEGSSPLYFDDTKQTIIPEAGKMVLFESHVKHSVPKNNCYGRSVIAGNIEFENIILQD